MRPRLSLMVMFCALVISMPAVPSLSSEGRAPDVLSTFSDGRASAEVRLEPRPASDSSLSLSLPWDAAVSSAAMRIGPADRSVTVESSFDAQELSQLPISNLTLSGQGLQLSRGSWNWSQSGAELGANCSIENGTLDGGYRLNHSNPALSGSGGGVWLQCVPITVSEQDGLARTNETVNVHVWFVTGTCVNPQKEVRVTDPTGAEQPVFVHNASYSQNKCVGADLLFVLPALEAYAEDTYYMYYDNPEAQTPSYDRLAYLAEPFTGPDLPSLWTVSNVDGLSYSVDGDLQVQGTASSEFWQGVSFERQLRFPAIYDIRFTLLPGTCTGTGYQALVSVAQDGQNSVNLGIQYDSGVGQLSPAKFTLGRTVSGATTIDFAADAGSPGVEHSFRLACEAGTFSGYVDENLLGSVDMQLSGRAVRLSAATRAIGDTIDVSFDEVVVSTGFSSVSVKDPVPSVQAGAAAQAGYGGPASLTSPLLENAGLLPLGVARLDADVPEGTTCTLSVLGPSNETLASGLSNGQSVTLSPADLPTFRLRAELSTTDAGRTPRLRSWGIGDLWSGDLRSSGEYSLLQNLTPGASGAVLERAPDRWNRSATPALNLGVASTFDDQGVAHPWVLEAEGGYRMYYAGYDGARWRIGLATSADGTSWTRYPDNPVMVPEGGFEASTLDWPCVVYNGHGYEMWYAGSSDGGATFRIGYAVSEDGITWVRDTSNPVVGTGAPGSWSATSVFAPRVRLDFSGYTMWYAGRGPANTSIGMATSPDGFHWGLDPYNPVLGPASSGWSSGGVVPGGVQRLPDGSFRLWYAGINATLQCVGLADSPDGWAWTARPQPVLSNGTGTAFDKSGASYPSVLFDQARLWYTAYDGARFRIGQCRAAFFAQGNLLSIPVDLGTAPATLRMTAAVSVPAGTNLTVQARSSADGTAWSGWTTLGPSPAPVTAGRYIQWAASFRSAINDSTPSVQAVWADLEYYHGDGALDLPPVSLLPSENLTSVTATPSFTGGTVTVLCSVDNGTSWQPLEPGVPFNISGTQLLLRTVLSGNYTATPRLSALACSYTYDSFPSDCYLDVGADGTTEWSSPGVLTDDEDVGGLEGALNAYLDAHRAETGDLRLIPLSFSSATSSAINVSGLSVDWYRKTFTNSPPRIDSVPPGRARPNELYFYVVAGRDPDRRDRLTYSLETAPDGMAISETTGEITWQPSVTDIGYHAVHIFVTDGKEIASQEYTLVVSSSQTNNPPHLSGSTPVSARVGYEYSCTFTATDPDGDTVHFSFARGAPAGAAVDGASGQLSWIPASDQTGLNSFELLASDGTDAVHRAFAVNVTAAGANGLPVVTSNATPTARANLPCRYNITATDPEADPLEFSLVSGPPNATLAPGGAFAWTPVLSETGLTEVVVKVSDGKGYILYNFTIRVVTANRAPLFAGSPAQLKIPAGKAWTFLAQASDDDSDALTYYLMLRPAGMVIDPATGALSWTPSPSLSGKYLVSVAATDGYNTTFLNFTLTVQGKAAPAGLLDQYGLLFALLIVVILVCGGVAAALSSRRKGPPADEGAPAPQEAASSAPESPGAEPTSEIPPGGPQPEPPSEAATAAAGPGLPPPEPAATGEAAPMKPVGTISKELQAAVDATNPPPAASMPVSPPMPPALEPSMAPPPPAEAPPAPYSGTQVEPAAEAASRPVIAPPLAPTLTGPAPAQPTKPAPAPAPTVKSSPELYKPIPGPYDDRPLRLDEEPAAEPLAALKGPTAPGQPAQPAAPAGKGTGLSEDMDFISSFLQSREKSRDEKVMDKSAEWGMLKDFKKELESAHETPKKAPPALPPPPPPAPARTEESPVEKAVEKPIEKPADGTTPRKPASSLTLDDILTELEP